jgi:hypothetical protein
MALLRGKILEIGKIRDFKNSMEKCRCLSFEFRGRILSPGNVYIRY